VVLLLCFYSIFTGGRVVRKVKSALYSSLILSGVFIIPGLSEPDGWILGLIVLAYSLLGTFVYGLPVSFLSDFLTKKMTKGKIVAAGFVHIILAYLTVFLIDGLAAFAVISAFLFFVIDELLKRKGESKKGYILTVLAFIPVVVLLIWGMNFQLTSSQEKTNNVYLVPEGYEGPIVVFYNIPGEPVLNKEGDYDVFPLYVKDLPEQYSTNMDSYATFRTSTKDRDYGIINNKFYYVDKDGNRTAIDEYCINNGVVGSASSSSEGEGNEIGYETFQVTMEGCGEDFYLHGSPQFDLQVDELLDNWRWYDELSE
jgi:hypothetical protein